MKHLQLIGLIACAAFIVSCETTETTGVGNQEAKRLAALKEQSAEPQHDESDQNLWAAQMDVLNRDPSPARR
jgi:hypothetical protein